MGFGRTSPVAGPAGSRFLSDRSRSEILSRKPGASILPFVLERTEMPRHTLPGGRKDRPIYPTASSKGAKAECGLVPRDSLGGGLGRAAMEIQAALSSALSTVRSRPGS